MRKRRKTDGKLIRMFEQMSMEAETGRGEDSRPTDITGYSKYVLRIRKTVQKDDIWGKLVILYVDSEAGDQHTNWGLMPLYF